MISINQLILVIASEAKQSREIATACGVRDDGFVG